MSFNSRIYDINWKKLARWITPFKWRRNDYLAIIYTSIMPINKVHTNFVYFRNFINYRLGITPQVVYLQKLLNDRFDPSARGIKIVKGIAYDGVPLFLKEELKPLRLYKKSEGLFRIFYTKEETLNFTVDFIVRVPILVPFDMNELVAYLDIDVLPSKTYKVQIV
jgi:hypothetical protein